MAARLILGT